MVKLQHPASLNAFQKYGQACDILRSTTRASNSAWYKDALSLDLQLHIRMEGHSITTFYYDRKNTQWSAGLILTQAILTDPALLEAFVASILEDARSKKASSLGVILHIADEFATAELKRGFDNPAELQDLMDLAVTDPGSILEDSSILPDQASWRVIPYPATGSPVIGSTITISKQYATLITSLREKGESTDFPIITRVLSAPLVAIMGLSQSIKPTPGKSFVAILQYPWFTSLAFFDESSNLRLIRTLQHRGARRPTNFRSSLATTIASLEFIDPDFFIVRLGADCDMTLEEDLSETFTINRVEVIQYGHTKGIPDWCPDLAMAVTPLAMSASGDTNSPSRVLIPEEWALQDFLPTPKETGEIFPYRSEIRLLQVLRLARVALFGITLLGIGYFCFGMIRIVSSLEWAFNPSEVDAAKQRIAKLNIDKQKAERWSNLLDDRSKAWASMESLSRMFPEGGGMLVKSYIHSAKPDNTPGNASAGFVKEWEITGLARDEALTYLNVLGTREGITAHFNEIARVTGNSAYDLTIGNRSIVVNLRTQESAGYKPMPLEEANIADESTYPNTFNLTITQRFEATDPMALVVSKAP